MVGHVSDQRAGMALRGCVESECVWQRDALRSCAVAGRGRCARPPPAGNAQGFATRLMAPRLAAAAGLGGLRRLCRPGKGHLDQFAAADLARGFHHQRVLAGRERLQRALGVGERQGMRAGRTGGAGDAVDRHLEGAPTLAPPLAQVRQPLGAVAFGGVLGLIPDGQIGGDLLVRTFQPDRHVRAVIFGDVELGDLDVDVERGGVCRHGEQAAQGDGQGGAHDRLR